MPTRRESNVTPIRSRRPAAKTPEGREQQLIAAAVDRAEQQLLDGTASAQVITHYLKLGSSRERLEQKRLEQENQLIAAKIESMSSQKEIERLYSEALAAMSAYSGNQVMAPTDE